MKCNYCGGTAEGNNKFCPNCGAEMTESQPFNTFKPSYDQNNKQNYQTYNNRKFEDMYDKPKKNNACCIVAAIIIFFMIMSSIPFMLIALPSVSKIINNSKISAAEDTAYSVLEATENYVYTYETKTGEKWENTATFVCSYGTCTAKIEGEENSIQIDNVKSLNGRITLDKNGNARIEDEIQFENKKDKYICKMNGDKVKCEKKA